MELKQLGYFVTVVAEGTISAAARKLNLSQPPLSTQIRLLEEEVGCILFERGARRIQLTEAGRLLYDRALTLLELSEVTQRELRDYREGNTGTLRLGVVSSVGSGLLTDWASSFHAACPSIRFELFEANTYQLLEQLRSNLVELAIIRTPFPEEGLERLPLRREPMLAVGHEKFWLRSGSPGQSADTIPLAALEGLPLILYRRWEGPLTDVFGQDGLTFSCFCLNDDARTTAAWADAGMGVGILPASSRPLIRNPAVMAYEIRDERLCSQIAAVYNRGAYLSTIAGMFLEYLQKLQEDS